MLPPLEKYTSFVATQLPMKIGATTATYWVGSYCLCVLNLKGAYNGQKLIRLVSKKIPAKTSKMMPNAPITVPLKYNTAIMIASTARMMRSAVPIFAFMITSEIGT